MNDSLQVPVVNTKPNTINKLHPKNNLLGTTYKRVEYMHLSKDLDSGKRQKSEVEEHESDT